MSAFIWLSVYLSTFSSSSIRLSVCLHIYVHVFAQITCFQSESRLCAFLLQTKNKCWTTAFFLLLSTSLIYFQLLYRSRLPIFNHLGKEFPAFCIRKRFNALFKNVCDSPVQNQMNPVNVVTYRLSMICLNIIFPTIPNLQTGCSCLLRV